MTRMQKRLLWFGFLCVLLVLLIALENGCAKKETKDAKIDGYTIRSSSTGEPIDTVKIREEVSIEAEVIKSPKDLLVTYKWEVKGGEIRGPEREPVAVYKAPDTPGAKFITLLVLHGDKELDRKSIPIMVEGEKKPPESKVLGNRMGNIEGELEYQVSAVQGFSGRINLKGLNPRHRYIFCLNGYPGQPGNDLLPQRYGDEGYTDFPQDGVTSDQERRISQEIGVELRPGKYAAKFLVKDMEHPDWQYIWEVKPLNFEIR